MENEKSRKVYYSKYKTTAFFYSRGEYIVEMFDDDTFKLTNPNGKERFYDVIKAVHERNDLVMILRNRNSGVLGTFRMMPIGKAEFQFETGTLVKLKI